MTALYKKFEAVHLVGQYLGGKLLVFNTDQDLDNLKQRMFRMRLGNYVEVQGKVRRATVEIESTYQDEQQLASNIGKRVANNSRSQSSLTINSLVIIESSINVLFGLESYRHGMSINVYDINVKPKELRVIQ